MASTEITFDKLGMDTDTQKWAREATKALLQCRSDLALEPLNRLSIALPHDPHVLWLRR